MIPPRPSPADAARGSGGSGDVEWRLLQVCARLLLEYNERATHIERQLEALAQHLGVSGSMVAAYRGVTLAADDGRVFRAEAREFRIDVAVSVATQRAIGDLCAGRTELAEAARRLDATERTASRHPGWLVVLLFGLAAASLASLLQADGPAIAASGLSAALGLMARRALASRPTIFVVPPFVAGLVGAVVGGLVIRADATTTPNLCLIVPALMLVPGPHLIVSIDDVLDNEMAAGIGRLCFATTILLGAALGVLTGAWLTLGHVTESVVVAPAMPLTLMQALALAGVASCGFAIFYNSPWRVASISIGCGMLGHGMRWLGLEWGLGLAVATLLASLGIGIVAGVASERLRLPFASVGFAAAVPMMPGMLMYQSIVAAIRLSSAEGAGDTGLALTLVSTFVHASFIVAAMVIGLATGVRIAASAGRWRPQSFGRSALR